MGCNVHSATFHCCVLHFGNSIKPVKDDLSVEGQALCAKADRVQSSREAHADQNAPKNIGCTY